MRFSFPAARRLLSSALLSPAPLFCAVALSAQTPPPDSARALRDTTKALPLERVTVRAIRGGVRGDAPITEKTLSLHEIERRHHGQDIPVLLQGTPSLTIKSETGTPWGYSYVRLRGMEQRRINFTLDGIPLNDPEDHVLYFADFPDLGNSVQSVQIQRGVGTSSTGVAAYAGSVNLETISLSETTRGADVQLQAGSFASRRASAEYGTGLLGNRTAFYGRLSALQTNGYRRHAGILGYSGFLSAGYFGARDIVKLTATAGVFADTMAYTGATADQIARDRRFNPLRPDETDRFGEQIAALTYIRSLAPAASLSTTAYRISAGGAFDVCIDRCAEAIADLWKFDLDFRWYGLTSTLNYGGRLWRLNVGVNGNTYERDHHAYARPDVVTPLYFNTGNKDDASGFAKAAFDRGRATFFADVQARYARFRYVPDRNAGIAAAAMDWSFLNPKAGVTYRLTEALSLYGSYGVNGREPARDDMFAGFDNLDTTNIAFVGAFDRVRPERARDLEFGVNGRTARVSLQANVFDMRFENEILPIGQLSYIGTPLRENVARSFRRGVEADVEIAATSALGLAVNATFMTSRIAEYMDRNGKTYRDVPALLTPGFQSAQRITWNIVSSLAVGVEGRYIATSHLTNTGDASLTLPSTYLVDASATWTRGAYSVSAFAGNLGNSRRYSTGNVSSSGRARYFVLAPANAHVLLRMLF